MGRIIISREIVQAECPEATAEVLAKIQRSESKAIQGVGIDQLEWGYHYYEKVDQSDSTDLDTEGRIEMRIYRVRACVRVSYGCWYVNSKWLRFVPRTIRGTICDEEKFREAEAQRIANLTPEQQGAELRVLLSKFVKDGRIIVSFTEEPGA